MSRRKTSQSEPDDEFGDDSRPRDRSFGDEQLVRALWWAAGTVCCVGPLLAAVWTPNRSPVFRPLLAVAALVGIVFGPGAWKRLRSKGYLTAWSRALLVAVLYPLSGGVGLAVEAIQSNDPPGTVLTFTAAGIALGALALALRFSVPRPQHTLRVASVVWAVVALVLFALVGFGGFVIPLAVSYYFSSQDAPEHRAVLSPNGERR